MIKYFLIMASISQQFINGLKKYNVSPDELKNWKYCGGDKGRHKRYFRLCFKDRKIPSKKELCICGHAINENCYIVDKNLNILVLGNCCIKRFIKKSSRTCEKCETPHKNRVVNRCNKCRKGICDYCDKRCNPSYKQCFKCYVNEESKYITDSSSDDDKPTIKKKSKKKSKSDSSSDDDDKPTIKKKSKDESSEDDKPTIKKKSKKKSSSDDDKPTIKKKSKSDSSSDDESE